MADGKVSKEDYERTVVPLLDEARREGKRLRIVCEVAPGFEGFTPGGAWEDVKLGVHALRRFDGCAVVTDLPWMREATRFARFLMPCPMRDFTRSERARAIEWLGSFPEAAAISHRLVPETGVLVVEVSQPLRAGTSMRCGHGGQLDRGPRRAPGARDPYTRVSRLGEPPRSLRHLQFVARPSSQGPADRARCRDQAREPGTAPGRALHPGGGHIRSPTTSRACDRVGGIPMTRDRDPSHSIADRRRDYAAVRASITSFTSTRSGCDGRDRASCEDGGREPHRNTTGSITGAMS